MIAYGHLLHRSVHAQLMYLATDNCDSEALQHGTWQQYTQSGTAGICKEAKCYTNDRMTEVCDRSLLLGLLIGREKEVVRIFNKKATERRMHWKLGLFLSLLSL